MFSQTSDKLFKAFQSGNQELVQPNELPTYLANPITNNESFRSESSKRKGQSPSEDLHNSVDKQLKLSNDATDLIVTDSVSEEVSHPIKDTSGTEVINNGSEVRHTAVIPPGYPYVPIENHVPPADPVRTYPFELDPFQKKAIASIQRGESVLVSAHTSAGKTVVAEYAIAQCLRNKQRVIYTSPIKALSNQKYREFLEEFGDVGLMTGDVTLSPNASCLVMTTEILRSMLYLGSEVMREVAWVVFDEVHYMRDKSRGVVWEETLILLPHTVKHVFLSATIPNALQFAQWVCKVHHQPCHVVYTTYRPTPLQHYLSPSKADGIFLVVDEKGTFREANFQKALGYVQGGDSFTDDPKSSDKKSKKGSSKKATEQANIAKIIKMILEKNFQPVIVFSFNRQGCESLAKGMAKLALNTDIEQKNVMTIFNNAIGSLSEEDRNLDQIQTILPFLKNGIGIHHSGLLPILKETIELLFQEGLVKVLFATETFSIGLNMPAKTVVFTGLSKFDGEGFRLISSGEYIQMSGRAGRRGLDDRGIVIAMIDSADSLDPAKAKEMIKGEADPLNSAFILKYNMILNLTRVDGFSPEYMLQHSFLQFQNLTALPKLIEQLKDIEEESANLVIENEKEVERYYKLKTELTASNEQYRSIVHHPSNALQFINEGRLAKVECAGRDYGWGIIVAYKEFKIDAPKPRAKVTAEDVEKKEYVVDVLLYCEPSKTRGKAPLKPDTPSHDFIPADLDNKRGEFVVVPVMLSTLNGMSKIRTKMPKSLDEDTRKETFRTLRKVFSKFPGGVPLLDPIESQNIKDEQFLKLVDKIKQLEKLVQEHSLHNTPELTEAYPIYLQKVKYIEKAKEVKKGIYNAKSVIKMDELKARKRVLRRLDMIDDRDVITLKGRVACEISSGDELMLTEMLFQGLFNDLDVPNIVALLSCFVFDEKTDEESLVKAEMEKTLDVMKDMVRKIREISQQSKLVTESSKEDDELLKTDFMDIAYMWAKGVKFHELCKKTKIFEGAIIRCFRRLEELLRSMGAAAKVIGNTELEMKFAEGIKLIKRDIVFAASLYL